MWDTLKATSQGSEEMLENKLSIACNKLDNFKMLHKESIEQMKNMYIEITLEINAIKPDKYKQRELNQKVIRALPASWHIYASIHPNRTNFNKLTIEELFDLLTMNEHEMIRIHRSTHLSPSSSKPKTEKKEKEVAFKAEVSTEAQSAELD